MPTVKGRTVHYHVARTIADKTTIVEAAIRHAHPAYCEAKRQADGYRLRPGVWRVSRRSPGTYDVTLGTPPFTQIRIRTILCELEHDLDHDIQFMLPQERQEAASA